MKISVGIKIAAVVLVLVGLVGTVAWINARSARHVESLIENVQKTYVPAYGALARANVRLLEEGLFARRWLYAKAQATGDETLTLKLKQGIAEKSREADSELKDARTFIQEEIADPTSFGDKLELARLDTELNFLQRRHGEYEAALAAVMSAADQGDTADATRRLDELDRIRDKFNAEADAARRAMLSLLDSAGGQAVQKQDVSVKIGLLLLALALALGAIAGALITVGLVRPLRRLLEGTALIAQGRLDIEVPVTSRDEVGELTVGFNAMVRDLRSKERIRETFGRYMDPRIVEGLIDRPDRLEATGERREMTIMFSDMRGFTSLSEGMTPAGMVRILNRYLALMSAPVRHNHGVIDKYIGDGIMVFWGPPFSQPEDQARLACLAGLEQLAALPGFRAELPEVTGFRRGLPPIDMRIGVATGEVVVGNIGSDVSMSYTVMGDSVNFASRLEGASKAYGTRFLVNARTATMASDAIEFREVDQLRVEGKQDPEHIFEVLGRRGEIPAPVSEMAKHYAQGLAAYRQRAWQAAAAAFAAALQAVPDDGPSLEFMRRVARLEADPPPAEWDGVWNLREK
jgi:class 3 adenylate cyclase